jgi:hypothetical protein
MRLSPIAIAIIATSAFALTACAPIPHNNDRVPSSVPHGPLPTLTLHTPTPSVPATATPSPSAAPSAAPSPSAAPVAPHYLHGPVLPTCDIGSVTLARGVTFLEGLGMDYVQNAPAGQYGTDVPALQSIIDTQHGISCIWLDHYSKRQIVITDSAITLAQRATIMSTLTANGYSRSSSFWEYYSKTFTSTIGAPYGQEACVLTQSGTELPNDFFICVWDNAGDSLGASIQDAEDAYSTLNPLG